jgi:glycolate oxidase iron-sulfur subunit
MTAAKAGPAPSTLDEAYRRTLDCVHCGLCTQHCPTYRVTGEEGKNPRGRIFLMRALYEGRAEETPDLVEDLDTCLVCRACEAAFPSGVRFGALLAETRARTRRPGRLRSFLLRKVVPHRRRLDRLASLLRLIQLLRLDRLAAFLSRRLKARIDLSPRIPPAIERRPLPRRAAAIGPRRGSVALFEGCVMRPLFSDVHRAVIALAQRAGYDVFTPEGQTCCGALHEHDGDLETARDLGRANAAAFDDAAYEAVIVDSAGCGAALKEAGRLTCDHGAAPDPRAVSLADRSIDWSRFLVDRSDALTFRALDDEPEVVATYDAPCHLLHAQGEATAPLDLLRRVPGLSLVPMEHADLCCGAGGAFNLDQPAMSAAVLDPKLDALARTGATVLLTGNPGCILQWRAGIARRGLSVRVEHPATFLAARLA